MFALHVLCVLLAYGLAGTAANPWAPCNLGTVGNLNILNCDGKGLTSVPAFAGQPRNIVHGIVLEHNNLGVLSDDAFAGFSSVTALNMDDANVQRLSRNSLRGLGKLTTLGLSNNRIAQISYTVFKNTPSLRILNIQVSHTQLYIECPANPFCRPDFILYDGGRQTCKGQTRDNFCKTRWASCLRPLFVAAVKGKQIKRNQARRVCHKQNGKLPDHISNRCWRDFFRHTAGVFDPIRSSVGFYTAGFEHTATDRVSYVTAFRDGSRSYLYPRAVFCRPR